MARTCSMEVVKRVKAAVFKGHTRIKSRKFFSTADVARKFGVVHGVIGTLINEGIIPAPNVRIRCRIYYTKTLYDTVCGQVADR